MTGIDELLTAAQRGLLRLQAVVITDWRDGPIEGIARLSAGDGLWKFKIFADDASSEDVSDRLYLLSALPKESVEPRIWELIAGVRLPLVWPFDDQSNAAAAKSAVDLALDASGQATLVVSSKGFDVVVKAWLVEVEFRPAA
ncbi:hypothetical protein [Micromonospora sp. A202]|uniref:hypothetical protein n=1 Tax=Micromonospora sp. A202 TaxID=2572899 RepID=UPI0011537EB2|nr:hypothetical protein [Micromonospora sp. A202]